MKYEANSRRVFRVTTKTETIKGKNFTGPVYDLIVTVWNEDDSFCADHEKTEQAEQRAKIIATQLQEEYDSHMFDEDES